MPDQPIPPLPGDSLPPPAADAEADSLAPALAGPPAPALPAALALDRREMRRRTRRGFIGLGLGALAACGLWDWLWQQPLQGGQPWPLRDALRMNEAIARRLLFSNRHLAPGFPLRQARRPIRTGSVGQPYAFPDLSAWRLRLGPPLLAPETPPAAPDLAISLAEIQALPRADLVAEFKCIEGWSRVVHWTGVRFRDFARHYPVFGAAGERSFPYVALTTSGRDYYVGFDRASILHPQTLLAYQMNGQPLGLVHGAPLRLVTPVKYGIKNIKWLSRIQAVAARPPDYWARRGYDWYAGL